MKSTWILFSGLLLAAWMNPIGSGLSAAVHSHPHTTLVGWSSDGNRYDDGHHHHGWGNGDEGGGHHEGGGHEGGHGGGGFGGHGGGGGGHH